MTEGLKWTELIQFCQQEVLEGEVKWKKAAERPLALVCSYRYYTLATGQHFPLAAAVSSSLFETSKIGFIVTPSEVLIWARQHLHLRGPSASSVGPLFQASDFWKHRPSPFVPLFLGNTFFTWNSLCSSDWCGLCLPDCTLTSAVPGGRVVPGKRASKVGFGIVWLCP